jgi:hypothetical protein
VFGVGEIKILVKVKDLVMKTIMNGQKVEPVYHSPRKTV